MLIPKHKPSNDAESLNADRLDIADGVSLPLSFVTSTQAIVAKKRVGKTYTAQVEAEELLAARQQVVVLDPTDAWWGLRSSADGASAGYPITIFGGRHADLPLEATAGAELADAIVSDKFSAVLSLKLFTKGERLRFAADFLETLYRKNTEAMHLFIDEADVFCPQKTWSPEQARCLGAADELVRRGGIDGIGITLITQRSAVINKDVLSQIDRLIVLRMNYPLDIKAIKDWISEHVDLAKAKEMLHSLPSLPKGDAWMWSPDTEQFERIAIRAKRTFDTGRTPKPGERRAEPKVLAPIDLERLGQRIAASVERARANDPKLLRAKIAELERKLAEPDRAGGAQQRDKLETKVAALLKERDTLDRKLGELTSVERMYEALTGKLSAALDQIADLAIKTRNSIVDATEDLAEKQSLYEAKLRADSEATARVRVVDNDASVPAVHRMTISGDGVGVPYEVDDNGLSNMETAMLTALAQHRGGLPKAKVLLHANYSAGGATSKCFAKITREGWVVAGGNVLVITQAGLTKLGRYTPLPTGTRLQRFILSGSRLSDMEKKLLEVICLAYPEKIGKREVLKHAGYAAGGATSSAFARLVAFDYAKSAGPNFLIAAEELFD